MKRMMTMAGLVLLASPAWAAHASEGAGTVMASMYVQGTISVSPKGRVVGYTLDQPGKLPTYVVQLLGRNIPTWRFRPELHDGHPESAKVRMGIRLVARPTADKKYAISIDQTTFGTGHEKDAYQVHYKGKVKPPPYPGDLAKEGVDGTVFVRARINRQGHVAEAAVEQVNLRARGAPNLMVRWRREFSSYALKAVRTWQFIAPTRGPLASADHWDVEIPVVFRHKLSLIGAYRDMYEYGTWQPYIPGPPQYIPWVDGSRMAAHAKPPAGGLHVVGSGLQRIDKSKS